MKKTLIIAGMLVGAVSGYSQGDVAFSGYVTGFKQQIFNVQATAPVNGTLTSVTFGGYTVSEYTGSTAATLESPQGTTVYAAGTALSGTGFSAQLLGAAGSGDTLSQLSALPGTTTSGILNFYTATAAAGFITGSDPVAIPGTSSGAPTATIAIAAWNNDGGLYTTLAAAQAASMAWGISPLSTITTTFTPTTPASLATGSDLNLSFSLGSVPEPSTIALGVMGASALLFRRRK